MGTDKANILQGPYFFNNTGPQRIRTLYMPKLLTKTCIFTIKMGLRTHSTSLDPFHYKTHTKILIISNISSADAAVNNSQHKYDQRQRHIHVFAQSAKPFRHQFFASDGQL